MITRWFKKTRSTEWLAKITLVVLMFSSSPLAAQQCGIGNKDPLEMLPLRVGEMAMFRISRRPVSLSRLSFKDENGATVEIGNWRGRVVLLNLWATWCGPCRREMPALDRLQKLLGGDRFEVVPVSLDRGEMVKAKNFYTKHGIEHLPIYVDSSAAIFEELKQKKLAFGLPTTILIDKNSCVVGTFKGAAEWHSDDAQRLIKAIIEE